MHAIPEGIAGPQAATQFQYPAFGMPRETSSVRVTVQRVRFASGSEWEATR